jgi:hypothetical protein
VHIVQRDDGLWSASIIDRAGEQELDGSWLTRDAALEGAKKHVERRGRARLP